MNIKVNYFSKPVINGHSPVDERSCGRVMLDAIKSAFQAIADFFTWLFSCCCCCNSPEIGSSPSSSTNSNLQVKIQQQDNFNNSSSSTNSNPQVNIQQPESFQQDNPNNSSSSTNSNPQVKIQQPESSQQDNPNNSSSPTNSSPQPILLSSSISPLAELSTYLPLGALQEKRAQVEEFSLESWELPKVEFPAPLNIKRQAGYKCLSFKKILIEKFKESTCLTEPLALYVKAKEEIQAFNKKLGEKEINDLLDEDALVTELRSWLQPGEHGIRNHLFAFVGKLKNQVIELLTTETKNLKIEHLEEIFAYCEHEIDRYKALAISLEFTVLAFEAVDQFQSTFFPEVEWFISCLEKMHRLVGGELDIEKKVELLAEIALSLPDSDNLLWKKHGVIRDHMGAVLMPLTFTYFSNYQFQCPEDNGYIEQINHSYMLLAKKLGATETPEIKIDMVTENDSFLARQQALLEQEAQFLMDAALAALLEQQ